MISCPPWRSWAGADEVVRVTLALSRNSVDFFKEEAAKHKTVYQRVIRRLLDEYVEQIQQRKPKP